MCESDARRGLKTVLVQNNWEICRTIYSPALFREICQNPQFFAVLAHFSPILGCVFDSGVGGDSDVGLGGRDATGVHDANRSVDEIHDPLFLIVQPLTQFAEGRQRAGIEFMFAGTRLGDGARHG